jgi:hypothetical protein
MTEYRRQTPRIIFNSDGDIHFRCHQPWINSDQFFRGLNELEGTHVDVYCYCFAGGGDIVRHPSKIAPLLGEDLKDLENVPNSFRLDIENTRMLLETGKDPMVTLPRRARELGMQFWASMRMNDIHDDFPECAAYHGSFKKAHPELLIGSPYPEPTDCGNWESDFSWALNYAKAEVRSRQLAIIEEVLTDYDVDGFELDFLRGPYYFKTDERRLGLPLMTDFVRKVRAKVDEISRQKMRHLTLAIRVGRTFEECERAGLDARTWIREERADLFLPMWSGRLDMEADVRGFVEAAQGTSCQIAGGLVGSSYGYGHLPDHDSGPWRNATIEMLRAAAMSYYHQGASCIYLFNYDCQRFGGRDKPYSAEEIQALKEIGDVDLIARKNKRYVVSFDHLTRFSGKRESTRMQLPAVLKAVGDERRFTFNIGDDMGSAERDGVLEEVRLRLTIDGYRAPGDGVAVRLNKEKLKMDFSSWRPQALMFSGIPVQQGMNELLISLLKRRESEQTPLQITGIEVLINYRTNSSF